MCLWKNTAVNGTPCRRFKRPLSEEFAWSWIQNTAFLKKWPKWGWIRSYFQRWSISHSGRHFCLSSAKHYVLSCVQVWNDDKYRGSFQFINKKSRSTLFRENLKSKVIISALRKSKFLFLARLYHTAHCIAVAMYLNVNQSCLFIVL